LLHYKGIRFILLVSLACTLGFVSFRERPVKAQGDPFAGPIPIVPRWAFEPWVWEDNTNTQESTVALVQGYLERDIPTGAVIVDSPWSTYENSFEWDPERYPDAEGMIAGFHDLGVRVVLWVTGFINRDSPDYETVKTEGFGVADGQDFFWWRGTGIHLDFTNPKALEWWHTRMDRVMDMGIGGWKVDRSVDYVSDPVETHLGSLSQQAFKEYFYADFFDYSIQRNPQAITLARSYSGHQSGAGAPVSKVSVGWSGDFHGNFSGLEAQKNDVYRAARMGYAAPGVEIGGYGEFPPDKRSLIRYTQFASLTPLMENGGLNGGEAQHLPWFWDQETIDIYRYYAVLHSELVPYLFSYGVEANLTGESILRDVDPERSQHLLGEEVLVSVITSDTETKRVFFPSGERWIDYWNEAVFFEGGMATPVNVPLQRYPIFIRAGAILPLNVTQALAGHGDGTSAGKTTLLIYPYGESSFTFHRPTGDGIEYSDVNVAVNERAGTIAIRSFQRGNYRLRVKSFTSPTSIQGANRWYYDADTQYIVIDQLGANFTITIQGLAGYSQVGNSLGSPAGSSDRPGPTEGGRTVFAPMISRMVLEVVKERSCREAKRISPCRPVAK
jgi:alpha-glucosidase (family GH31 glycosyl hydrolase)